MVMIGKEFLFLTKRMITHFFSLMRTVSKSNYSCMLAISFSIDTKFSPINSSGFFFFFAKLGFSRIIISIRLWNLIIQSTYFNLEKSLMAHYFKEPSFVKHMIVKKKKKKRKTILLLSFFFYF